MSHWIFCCPPSCPIMSDDFNRMNSDVLGDKWYETVADADIASTMLKMEPGAIVTGVQPHPTPHQSFVLVVDATGPGEEERPPVPDQLYQINFHAARDPVTGLLTSYRWVRYITSDGPPAVTTLSVGTTPGGELHSESINEFNDFAPAQLGLCFNLNGIFAESLAGGALELYWPFDGTHPGYYVGLEAPDTNTEDIYWDDFAWAQHQLTYVECSYCFCNCDDLFVSRTLKITIDVVGGICTCWDGLESDLNFSPTGEDPVAWDNDGDLLTIPNDWDECDRDPPLPIDEFVRLYCQGTTWSDWILCFVDAGYIDDCGVSDETGGCGPVESVGLKPVSGSCDPFMLVFGKNATDPFTCDSESGECSFWITITER